MGPSPFNVPIRHHGINISVRPQHTVSPATFNPPLPQCIYCNRAKILLCPGLRRAQYLPPNVLLPISPPGPHLGDTLPGRFHRTLPPPLPSIIGCTRKCTAACDEVPGLITGGTGPPLQGRVWGVSGPTGQRGHHHSGSLTRHKELHAGSWGLIGC